MGILADIASVININLEVFCTLFSYLVFRKHYDLENMNSVEQIFIRYMRVFINWQRIDDPFHAPFRLPYAL